jgi:hypothetical protein
VRAARPFQAPAKRVLALPLVTTGSGDPAPRRIASVRVDLANAYGHTDENGQTAENDHEVHDFPRSATVGTPTGLPGAVGVAGVFLRLGDRTRKG